MAGRKPKAEHLKKVRISCSVSLGTREYLENISEKTGYDLSNIIEQIILEHKEKAEKAERKSKKQTEKI